MVDIPIPSSPRPSHAPAPPSLQIHIPERPPTPRMQIQIPTVEQQQGQAQDQARAPEQGSESRAEREREQDQDQDRGRGQALAAAIPLHTPQPLIHSPPSSDVPSRPPTPAPAPISQSLVEQPSIPISTQAETQSQPLSPSSPPEQVYYNYVPLPPSPQAQAHLPMWEEPMPPFDREWGLWKTACRVRVWEMYVFLCCDHNS
jgi:hypothetical protein